MVARYTLTVLPCKLCIATIIKFENFKNLYFRNRTQKNNDVEFLHIMLQAVVNSVLCINCNILKKLFISVEEKIWKLKLQRSFCKTSHQKNSFREEILTIHSNFH